MALSNIFREPRREITETAVGIVAVAVALTLLGTVDYHVAVWFEAASGDTRHAGLPWQAGMSLLPFFAIATVVIVGLGSILIGIGTHAAGEAICNRLERRGVQLRPRQRY